MESSKIGLQKWAIAIYMVTTNLKSISSMELYSELGIAQKSAWFMLNRIRTLFEMGDQMLCSMVEIDETYMGGLEKNTKKNSMLEAAQSARMPLSVERARI